MKFRKKEKLETTRGESSSPISVVLNYTWHYYTWHYIVFDFAIRKFRVFSKLEKRIGFARHKSHLEVLANVEFT
jgi:hypothetical protein